LASRHHSLEMTELADLRDVLVAFEVQNNVTIHFRFGLMRVGKAPDISLTAEAFQRGVEVGDQASLASVNVVCSALNLKAWNAVLIHVLYALDFQLAVNEFDHASKKRA